MNIHLKSEEKKFLILATFLFITYWLIGAAFTGTTLGDAFAICALIWVCLLLWAVIWLMFIIASVVRELWRNSQCPYLWRQNKFYAFLAWLRRDDR